MLILYNSLNYESQYKFVSIYNTTLPAILTCTDNSILWKEKLITFSAVADSTAALLTLEFEFDVLKEISETKPNTGKYFVALLSAAQFYVISKRGKPDR